MLDEWTNKYNPFNSFKVLAYSEHLQMIADGEIPPFPIVVNWDPVRGCNYKCKYCIWSKRRDLEPTKVPLDLALKIPKFLHNWGVKAICVGGESGDPSLYPGLHKVLKEFHYWNLDVGLVSNGFALTDKQIRAVAHYTTFTGFSMDAGTPESYAKVKGIPEKNFEKVIENIKKLVKYKEENNLDVQIGFKFLLLPESYDTLYKAAEIARDIGANHFHVRPAELPVGEIKKIDISKVNDQIEQAMKLETKDFGVFGIKHKFNPDFTKKTPKHCYATPLTSTWTADGDVHLCVDLRDCNYDILCNYRKEGLQRIKELWGSEKHRKLVEGLNQRLDDCKRCTNYGYNEIIEKAFVKDSMDLRLI